MFFKTKSNEYIYTYLENMAVAAKAQDLPAFKKAYAAAKDYAGLSEIKSVTADMVSLCAHEGALDLLRWAYETDDLVSEYLPLMVNVAVEEHQNHIFDAFCPDYYASPKADIAQTAFFAARGYNPYAMMALVRQDPELPEHFAKHKADENMKGARFIQGLGLVDVIAKSLKGRADKYDGIEDMPVHDLLHCMADVSAGALKGQVPQVIYALHTRHKKAVLKKISVQAELKTPVFNGLLLEDVLRYTDNMKLWHDIRLEKLAQGPASMPVLKRRPRR